MDKTVYRYNPMRVDTVEDFLNITSVINGDTKVSPSYKKYINEY